MDRTPEEESTRDIVATVAMAAMVVSSKVVFVHEQTINETCQLAYKFADAMNKASKEKV